MDAIAGGAEREDAIAGGAEREEGGARADKEGVCLEGVTWET